MSYRNILLEKYVCNVLCMSYRNILLEKYVSNKMFLIERIFY